MGAVMMPTSSSRIRRLLAAGFAAAALALPVPAGGLVQSENPDERQDFRSLDALRRQFNDAATRLNDAASRCDRLGMSNALAEMDGIIREVGRFGATRSVSRGLPGTRRLTGGAEQSRQALLSELTARRTAAAAVRPSNCPQPGQQPAPPGPGQQTPPAGTGVAPATSTGSGAAPVTSTGTGAAPSPLPGPAGNPPTPAAPQPPQGEGPPSRTLSYDSFYESFDRFERARDRCNINGMRLELATMEGRLEFMRTSLRQETIPRRQEHRRDEIRTAEAILESSRRAFPVNCPPGQQPPPPPPPPPAIETPVNPTLPPTDEVMQLPDRPDDRWRATFNASFGGAYLFDDDLDLGLALASFEADFPLFPGEFDESGLGNVRLGTKFRLVGEVGTGIHDERNAQGEFRDSVGVDWSAAALGLIVLPVGDEDSGIATGGTDFGLFGGAGYGFARFNFELTGPGIDFSESDTEDFFLFRAGGEIFFDEHNGVRAAYTRWDDFQEDGISANVFSVSYVRRFGGGRR